MVFDRLVEFFLVRPDAISVWSYREVRESLSWYYSVMVNEKPAKYRIVKRIEAPLNPYEPGADLGELWKVHDKLAEEFKRVWRDVRETGLNIDELGVPKYSFLDVKIALARELMRNCSICERRCGARRWEGKPGVCLMADQCIVHSYFHHLGEEAPLVPSGTIFYGGCNFRCVFCQNYDISQVEPRGGVAVTPRQLALIQEELRRYGARNINHVGGEPTPNIHTILASFKYLNVNVPQLWNSNMYLTQEALRLILHVMDIWLPDFKYGNDQCATRLSAAPRYFEVVTRNLREAVMHGDMIIRHLVLPGHIECCTKPVLKWIAENLPRDRVLVNIMDQYRPEFMVLKYPRRWPEITRRPSRREMEEAYEYARRLGIVFEPVS